MKKHIYFYLLSFFFLLFSAQNAFSKHIINGALTYTQIAPNQYQITLTLYRDCFSGTSFDDQVQIPIYDAGLSLAEPAVETLSVNRGAVQYIPSNIIYGECIDNNVPPSTNVCYEKTEYIKTITLPANTKGYWVAYGRCCRAGTISNIFAPEATGMALSLFIPPASLGQNSSPQFLYTLPNSLVLGATFNIPFTCHDADGDSLAYHFSNPTVAGDNINSQVFVAQLPFETVIFLLPYTYSNPFNTTPAPILNAKTGVLTVTPTTIGNFLFEVTVSEYRNKVLLSSIQQQIVLNVINNNVYSALPNITTEGNVAGDTLVFYANGENQCFPFHITDGIVGANSKDSVFLQGSGDLFSGNVFGNQTYATFSATKGEVPFNTDLCWFPTCDMNAGLGQILISMTDNDTCGGHKTVQKTYFVRFKELYPTANLSFFKAKVESETEVLLSWASIQRFPPFSFWKIERKEQNATTWQEIARISDINTVSYLDKLTLSAFNNSFCYRISNYFECLGEVHDYSKEVCTNGRENPELIFSPNPLASYLPAHLSLYGFVGQGANVFVFDNLGRKLFSQHIENGENEVFFEENAFSNWKKGVYYLEVVNDEGTRQKALPFVLK